MIFYISDLHLGHGNVIRFDGRPFADLNEMFHTLRDNWNSVVGKDDMVYILGDFIWDKEPFWANTVRQFNGHKVLIRGNHDPKEYSRETRALFDGITDYLEITDNQRHVIMSHYPIPCFKGDYNDTSYMLYGHVHNTREAAYTREFRDIMRSKNSGARGEPLGQLLHVGCMEPYMNYTPRTLDQIIEGDAITYPHP